jgi:hypothetical protein
MSAEVHKKYSYKGYNWSDKSLGEMAEEVGRGGQYKTMYRLSSQHTHSHSRVMNDYVRRSKTGYINFAGVSDNWVEEDLVMAFDFFSGIFAAASDQYGWQCEKELDKLYKDYLEVMEADGREYIKGATFYAVRMSEDVWSPTANGYYDGKESQQIVHGFRGVGDSITEALRHSHRSLARSKKRLLQKFHKP